MYTDKFKQRVLSAYPDSPEIERLLLEGSWALGEKLKKFSHIEIRPQDILECRTIQEAHKLASTIAIRTRLYEDWLSVGNEAKTSVPCIEQVRQLFGDDGLSYLAPGSSKCPTSQEDRFENIKRIQQQERNEQEQQAQEPWKQHMMGEPGGYSN